MKITAYGAGISDPGTVRTRNDDSFLVDNQEGIYMVCDGVSGQAKGDEASRMAVEWVAKWVRKSLGNKADPSVLQSLQDAIDDASERIYREGQNDPAKKGMSTTLDLLKVSGRLAFIAHVGDSRVYMIRAGKIHRLTEDHTFTAELVKTGKLSSEDSKKSPYNHVLTRAVGHAAAVQADVLQIEVMPGDIFVLCSDGVTACVSDPEILEAVSRSRAAEATRFLIDLSKKRGARDNVTLVCVEIGANEASKSAPAPRTKEEDETPVDPLMKMETLAKIPLFRYLTYAERAKVLALANLARFKKSAKIVDEGSPGDSLFIILSGNVGVYKGSAQVSVRNAGEVVGEMSLIDQAPRSATLKANEDLALLAIKNKQLFELLRKDSRLAVKILWAFSAELNSRLRSTTERLAISEKKAAGVEELPVVEVDVERPF